MKQPPEPTPWTWQERYFFTLFLCEILSLTVLPFLRRNIGMRVLSFWRVLMLTAILLFIGDPTREGAFGEDGVAYSYAFPGPNIGYDPTPFTPPAGLILASRPGFLGVFALLFFIASAKENAGRWRDYARGVKTHSAYRGDCYLSFLPFSPDVLRRRIEPLVCLGLGYAVGHSFSTALGGLLVFAGLSLRFVEATAQRWQFKHFMSAIDAAIEGEALNQLMQDFDRKKVNQPHTAGTQETLQSAFAPDIDALLAGRQTAAAIVATPEKTRRATTRKQRLWRIFTRGLIYDWWMARKEKKQQQLTK